MSKPIERDQFVEVDYNFVSGKRKGTKVLFVPSEKQIYHRNTKLKIGMSYRCQEPNCNARVHISNGKCFKLIDSVHEHREVEDVCSKTIIIDEMKRMTVEVKNLTVREIYNDVMSR